MKLPTTTLLLGLALALPALAAEEPAAIGTESKAWLQLQNSGKQAAGGERPMPGEIADAVYQRYVESFKHPIPERFEREPASGAGGAANGGGQ